MFVPLIIGPEECQRIREVIAHAILHPVSFEQLLARTKDPSLPPPGDDPGFHLRLPAAFSVVYTHEEQRPPVGMTRHISVALHAIGHVPHPAAVEMIMGKFGFRGGLSTALAVWEQAVGKGLTAINVVEPIEPIQSLS